MNWKHLFTYTSIAAIAYLAAWPVGITPVVWSPPAAPEQEKNQALATIERIGLDLGKGPEGVSLDAHGRIYAGYKDGRVVRFSADGKNMAVLANTGGRPLGTWVPPAADYVLVADANQGLLRISNGKIEVLAQTANGIPLKMTNDLVEAKSGDIYFTDASTKFSLDQLLAGVLEHDSRGRLLKYNPASKTVETLLSGVHVANGIALSPDEDFLLVAETLEYKVLRYWLKGAKAGTIDIFAENLPGFPDNISFNGHDGYWLALVAPRDAALDGLGQHPEIRKALYRLPAALRPAPANSAGVIKLDLTGHVQADLQDSAATAYAPITSVKEHNGVLYFGSIEYPAIGRMSLPITAASR